jgi:hypothetical protein
MINFVFKSGCCCLAMSAIHTSLLLLILVLQWSNLFSIDIRRRDQVVSAPGQPAAQR